MWAQWRGLSGRFSGLILPILIFFGGAEKASAAVLWSASAEGGTCNTAVPFSAEWDYRGSGDGTNAQFWYRCDTPVPKPGHTKYFRADTIVGQHDAYNIGDFGSLITLSHSNTYYFGGFFRFDRISSQDIWQDGAQADSYDKLLDLYGGVASFRVLITAGWHYGYYNQAHDHQYTFGAYVSPTSCSGSNCETELVDANVAPYGRDNPYLCDYGKWYAVVMKVNPSSGNNANDGLIELFVNGTKIYSEAGATQNVANSTVESFQYSGTIAQAAYDAPPHYRKAATIVLTDSLTDITNLGLMSDPEAGGDTTPPAAPTGLARE